MKMSLEALRNRNASRLFCGQFISQICDKMMTVGLVWIIAKEYAPDLIPWFLAASTLPHLALAWVAGGWINRLGPLKTVILTDWARGTLFVVLAAFWPRLPAVWLLPALFATSMASNLAGALFNPAIMSLPIYAVEEPLVQNVTAMLDTCFSLGTVLGPALSALLYPWLGLRGLFLFNGLSYVFAAALESGIRVNPISLELAAALAGTTEVGHHFLRVLKKDALVRFMLVSFLAINLFLGPLTAFLPIIIQTEHHGSLRSLAQFETSIGIGTVCGGIFLSLAKWQAKTGVKILTSMAAMSLSYLCFALSHGMGAGCFLLACLGFTLALGNVTVLGLFQIRPAPEDVPTVMSLVNLISVASLPLAMTLSAILLQKIQLRLLDVAFGVILCLITAVTALNAELRRL